MPEPFDFETDLEPDYEPTAQEIDESLTSYNNWLEEVVNEGGTVETAIATATDHIMNTADARAKAFLWLVRNDYASIYDVDFKYL